MGIFENLICQKVKSLLLIWKISSISKILLNLVGSRIAANQLLFLYMIFFPCDKNVCLYYK